MHDVNLRLFIAFELPDEIRAAIAGYMQPLRSLPGRVSWVKTENIHLTLKFFGDTPGKRIDDITTGLREIAAATPPIVATITGSGVFPNARRPRVVWIGLEEKNGTLQKLASAIDDRMHALGFEKANRPFNAHLTIGRVREGSIEKTIATMQAMPFGSYSVFFEEITLMRSELHPAPAGAIYTPISKIKLNHQ